MTGSASIPGSGARNEHWQPIVLLFGLRLRPKIGRMPDLSIHLLLLAFLPALALQADEPNRGEPIPRWAVDVLERQGLAAEPEPLCDWLASQLPDKRTRQRVEELIGQLASPDFESRERATGELGRVGRFFQPRLESALEHDDPEVASRVRRILRRLEGGRDQSGTTLTAVLRVLRSRPTPRAVPLLLDSMSYLPDGEERDLAAEVVWRSAGVETLPTIRAATKHTDPFTRAVGVVALEAVLGAEAVPVVEPLLSSDDPVLRVAAGRALVEHRPGPAWRAVLVGLKSPENGLTNRMARVAATVLSGDRNPSAFPATLAPGRLPDGDDRWCNTLSETTHLEDFGTDRAVVVGDEFRGWRLDSKDPEKPVVDANELRFPSPRNENDVRMLLPFEDVLPAEATEWRLEVDVRSDGNNPVAWHPGVSLGEVKILFHPGYGTGAFRIETRAGHRAIVSNQNMGYTPRTGVFHRVVVDVHETEKGRTATITVTDLGRPADTFSYDYELPDNRIPHVGLERSGRSGGVATFRRVRLVVPRPLR